MKELQCHVHRYLKQTLNVRLPSQFLEINTVDAFQGSEKDIILFSTVRSQGGLGLGRSKKKSNVRHALGFLTDYRRMNVALTRAKHCLIVLGNSATLQLDAENWSPFYKHCLENKLVKNISMDKPTSAHLPKINQ